MTTSTGDKLSPTDLIALAKQAGMKTSSTLPDVYLFNPTTLQAFADLIAQREMNRCTEIVKRYYNGHHIAKVIESKVTT